MLRDLTSDEKAVLEFLVSQSGENRPALVEQLTTAKATGSSCSCGCPSIGVQVDGRSPRASVVTGIGALADDADGNLVLVGLHLREGVMVELDFTDIAASSKTGAVGFPQLHSLRPADNS